MCGIAGRVWIIIGGHPLATSSTIIVAGHGRPTTSKHFLGGRRPERGGCCSILEIGLLTGEVAGVLVYDAFVRV
jgi:hypothetical protein